MRFRKYLLLWLLWMAPAMLLAAPPSFRSQYFATELAQSNVHAILQDHCGYIYMGTRNGLCRYDGQRFRYFKSYPGDACCLTTNRLDECFLSPNNYIWCISNDHECFLFDPNQERFFAPLATQTIENGGPIQVEWIYPLDNGITWVACKGCAFRIDESQFDEQFQGGAIQRYVIGEKGIAGHRVEKIRLDADGNEWLLTDLSVRCFGANKQTPQRGRSYICPTETAVWIAESHGRLSRYDRGAGNPPPAITQIPDTHGSVRNIQQIGADTLGICTELGLSIYYADQERFEHIPLVGGEANRFYRDSHDCLWIFTDASGVFRHELETGKTSYLQTAPEDMPHQEQGSMIFWHEDHDGNIIVNPHDGALGYYNPETGQLESLHSFLGEPYRKVTRRYCVDRQGNLWLGETMGVTRLTLRSWELKSIVVTGSEAKAMLMDRQERLWATSRDCSIRLFDKQDRLLGYLGADGAIHERPVLFSAPIYCMHEDEDGTIWLGSRNKGLFRLTPNGNRNYRVENFCHAAQDSYSLSCNNIYDICRDRHGRLWVGTYDGGVNMVFDEQSATPRFLHRVNLLPYPQQAYHRVRTLLEIGDYLLVGTTQGLVVLSTQFSRPEEIRCYSYSMDGQATDNLLSNDIRDIHYTSSGEIYLLGFSGGLSRLIPELCTTERLCCENLTRKEGLPSEQVLSMVEDPETGYQWIVTETEVFRFDPATRQFKTFGSQYRSSTQFFSEAKPLLRDNRLFVGLTNALCSVRTDPAISQFVPPILLTELRVNDQARTQGVDQLGHLELKSNERNVALSFTALDFSDPQAVQYAYRFRNTKQRDKSASWSPLGYQSNLHFFDLDAGSYQVEIRSTNGDGEWVDNTLALELTVAPTFWETRWVWLLYAVLLALAILIPVTILRLRTQVAMEKRLSATKLHFYTNISHELRTPLTLITAPIDLLLRREQLTEEGRNELTVVRRNTQRLIHTVNQILDFRKIENHKMRLLLEQGDVLKAIRQTMNHFELLAAERSIDYRLECADEVLMGWFDRDKLEKILFNLLSNAFKYTPAGRAIKVCVGMWDGNLKMEVVDQGQGIDEETLKRLFVRFETLVRANLFKPSSGIGLSLVQELVQLHGGTITVKSEVEQGSCFTVMLPIEQQAYKALEYVDFLLDDHQQSEEADASLAQLLPSSSPSPAAVESSVIVDEADDRWRILVVEDNEELRTMICNILSAEYTVFAAADGVEGLAVAQEHQPNLVISDIMMPHMDGLDMVKAMKSDPNTSHILILLLSAKSSLDDRIQGLESGVDDYIPKPFHASYLMVRIRSLIARRQEFQQRLLAQLASSEMMKNDSEKYITPEALFLRKAVAIVESHLDDGEWSMGDFASELCLSTPALYRKMKAAVDLSPVEFVRELRLKRACQLIRERHHNIAAISDMVGFSDPKYFTRVFKKRFGVAPSQWNEQEAETSA
ncbi:MAG: response regulator [Alistipes sp.]|nr:response regulator [Alistipes sp.]